MGYLEEDNLFERWLEEKDDLLRAAEITVEEVLQIKEGEKVLIVSNPQIDVAHISCALYDAAYKRGAAPSILFQPIKSQMDFAEPTAVNAVESGPDVLISMSAEKFGKDEKHLRDPYEVDGKQYTSSFHYLLWGKKQLRAFWSPSITRELFARTIPIDYEHLRMTCTRLKAILDHATHVKISAPGGTRVHFGLEGRSAYTDDGDYARPGYGGNLPAGEVFISPVVGSAEGMIVFDGSIAVENGTILIHEPIVATVENGYIVEITGGEEAALLKQTVERAEENSYTYEKEGKIPHGEGVVYARNARNIGELGIGLNPAAEIVGNMLVDEKAYSTCHFAVGYNYDRDARALIHLDGLIRDPSIVAVGPDGIEQPIMENGKPCYES
jgi:leucyl aminopeptidase (aminopeptidase T)